MIDAHFGHVTSNTGAGDGPLRYPWTLGWFPLYLPPCVECFLHLEGTNPGQDLL